MAEPLVGKLEILDAAGKPVLSIDPDSAPIKLRISLNSGWKLADVGASTSPNSGGVGMFSLYRGGGSDAVARIDGASLRLGAPGAVGEIVIRDMGPQETVKLNGFGQIMAGGNGADGQLQLQNAENGYSVSLAASSGGVSAGGGGKNGTVEVRNAGGGVVARLSAADASVSAGGANKDGKVAAKNAAGADVVTLDAAGGSISAGGGGKAGTVVLAGADGKSKIRLGAGAADCHIGGNGTPGELALYASAGNPQGGVAGATIYLRASNAEMRVGGAGQHGDIIVVDAANRSTIQLNGQAGDILLANADCAEEFDVADLKEVVPGSVLVLDDEPGRLRLSRTAYDTRVAGIVSGAGDYRPGIVLDRRSEREGRLPVALVGKVWCRVEAESAPIRVGTLLTTSSLAGHAMAATDRERAFGAVLGKALAPLDSGVGLVPVLVALQ